MALNLNTLTPQEQVATLFIAYFDRAPAPSGLEYWVGELESGNMTLEQVANSFSMQLETFELYPQLGTPNLASPETNLALVTDVFQNLFGRDPANGADNYWVQQLNDGADIGKIVVQIANGAVGDDLARIENKIEVGLDWAASAAAENIGTPSNKLSAVVDGELVILDQAAYDSSKSILDGVDDTDASVEAAKLATDQFIADYVAAEEEEAENANILELGSDEINPGETYTSETVILSLTENPPTSMVVNADTVIIRAENQAAGDIEVDVSNWTVGEFIVEDGEVNVSVVDIQGTDIGVEDQIDPTVVTTFNYDQQAAAGATAVGLSINEVYGGVAVEAENFGTTGDGIETLTVSIDDPANIESSMTDLTVDGIDTLNATGGNAGGAFTIEEALDAGLMTFNGSTSVADLSMNFSDSTEAMTVMGGSGDDTFDMGNTLGTSSAQDTLMGNDGEDTLVATFTDTGNRKPVSTGIEKFELDFQDNAQLDLEDVDDMHTIEITNVDDDQGVEIQDADSTFDTLLITGHTGGSVIDQTDPDNFPAGMENNDWEIGYKDIVDDENDQDTLNVIWQNNTDQTQRIDEFYVDMAEEVSFTFDGRQEMRIDNGFDLGFGTNGDDDEEVTEHLTIRNINDGDGTINTIGGMDESDRLETLTVETTDSGDLFLDGFVDGFFQGFIDDAAQLEEISVTASTGGSIDMGRIGSDEEAVELRNINVVTAGANITMGRIDGSDEANNDGASVSEFNISSDDDAVVRIEQIQVEDIETATFTIDDDSTVNIGPGRAPGIIMEEQGGTLTVSGDGALDKLQFGDEAFETMDFSGLTENPVEVFWANAQEGSNVIGTDEDDQFIGGRGDDTIDAGEGDDLVVGWQGSDVINGGDDDDELYGDAAPFNAIPQNFAAGDDTIDGGEGDDFIDGGRNATGNVNDTVALGDVLTGGEGNDTFYFNLDDDDTGLSTNGIGANKDGQQDVITDFTPGGDVIEIELASVDNVYEVHVFGGSGNFFTPMGQNDVQLVIRVGEYNANGTFNAGSGPDLQLLIDDDGQFAGADLSSSANAFNAADYEIGLLGSASDLGSLSTADFQFVV